MCFLFIYDDSVFQSKNVQRFGTAEPSKTKSGDKDKPNTTKEPKAGKPDTTKQPKAGR